MSDARELAVVDYERIDGALWDLFRNWGMPQDCGVTSDLIAALASNGLRIAATDEPADDAELSLLASFTPQVLIRNLLYYHLMYERDFALTGTRSNYRRRRELYRDELERRLTVV